MKSFFETPDKKKRHRLLVGDLAGITLNLYMSFFLFMLFSGTLKPFLTAIGNLAPFARVLAVVDLMVFFTAIFLIFGSVHIGIYHLSGLYRFSAVPDLRWTTLRLGGGVLFAILAVFILLSFLSKAEFPAWVWVFHAVSLFIILFIWRTMYFNKHVAHSPHRILIIGGDEPSREAAAVLSANGNSHFFKLTFVTEESFFKPVDIDCCRAHDGCDTIVYPFSHDLTDKDFTRLVKKKFEGTGVCDSLTFYKNCSGRFPVRALDALWLINLSVSLSLVERFQQRVKRVGDILVSGIGLLLALPLIGIVALLVRLTSRGPVFFVDERLGLHQKPFRLYKFRTMAVNAEKDTGPVWARKNDPRVTPVGRFLRKSRLDELPQLVNILKGDMSIVGPRPIRRYFADRLSARFPYYSLRFYVKPGLTGWAQVLGDYAGSYEGQLTKLEYDLFYIHEYSLFLDAEILLRTVKKVFMGAGQ